MTASIPPSPLNNDDVAAVYKQWDAINNFVETHQEKLRYKFTSSASGNHRRNPAKLTMDIALNESHQALRNVMYGLGHLFDPTKIDGPVSESYAAIQKSIQQHTLHVKKLRVMYEQYFGPGSSSPPKPESCPINKSDRFSSVDELKNRILKKSPYAVKDTIDIIQNDITTNNYQTRTQLQLFSQHLLQSPELTLRNTQGDELVIPNRRIVTPISSQVVSLGYVFYLLKKQSQNDIDDTARPAFIQEAAVSLFKQDSSVYKNIKQVLFSSDLDNQPIIVREFETERDLLIQRIAYHTHHYDTFMDEYPLHPENKMYGLLGLNQRDTFEEAKEAYLARLNTEKPVAEPRKKPVMTSGGKCPFGHG